MHLFCAVMYSEEAEVAILFHFSLRVSVQIEVS